MRKLIVTIFLAFFTNSVCHAQTDTINQFNGKGKKNGYWIRYLDLSLNPADSSNSFYYAFEYYDNGFCVYKFKKDKWQSKFKIFYANPNTQIQKGKPILLNGTFKWYWYESGPIAEEQIYVNGKPLFLKTYSWLDTTGTSAHNEVLYFDKLYNGQIGSYYYEEYGLYGRLDNAGYNCKEGSKWHYRKTVISPKPH